MIKLSPSILAADPLRLGQAARMAQEAGCDELHFDVMDGHFVPNLTFGPHILKAMKQELPQIVYDVQLMLDNPAEFVDPFIDAGADILTVHAEADGFDRALDRIRERGVQAGASVRPATPVECLRDALSRLDRVLLMTVEPGFGGQKLIPEVLDKAAQLRALGFAGEIEADGGIKESNAAMLKEAGIGVLVMGTGFFH
ncbi:MAG: ribulose-phosphate 3-epimerase, partial [Christensenellaceae bacterium]|nr:ribulose-phosphate 3-epimerase [Christensenellaceae bacterium]